MASSRTFILYDEFIGMRRVTEVRAAMADKEKGFPLRIPLGIPHDWTGPNPQEAPQIHII